MLRAESVLKLRSCQASGVMARCMSGVTARCMSSLTGGMSVLHPHRTIQVNTSSHHRLTHTSAVDKKIVVNMSKKRTLVSFDWAIKYILRDRANYDVLEGLLTALLGRDITVDALLESESNQEGRFDKNCRVDISARDDTGNIYLIEVQAAWEPHFLKRILYGSSKLIANHMDSGKTYKEVKKVISVSILYYDFSTSEEKDEYIHKGTSEEKDEYIHKGTSEEKDEYIHKGVVSFNGVTTGKPTCLKKRPREELNVFPEYYIIETERFHGGVQRPIDEWVYLLKNSNVEQHFNSRNIQVAAKKLAEVTLPAEKRDAYERYELDKANHLELINDQKEEGRIEGKEEGRIEGKEEGRIEGKEEGRIEGIEEGRIEGIEEGVKKGRIEGIEEGVKKIAVKMLRTGLPRDQVVQVTGLPEEEIRKLSE